MFLASMILVDRRRLQPMRPGERSTTQSPTPSPRGSLRLAIAPRLSGPRRFDLKVLVGSMEALGPTRWRSTRSIRPRPRRRRRPRRQRQCDDEFAAAAWAGAVRGDRAGMQLDEAVG